MKKLIIALMALVLVSSAVFAQGSQGNAGGIGTNQSDDNTPVQAGTVTQLRSMVQTQEQEMIQEMENMSEGSKKVYQNQNQVRLAVHALLSMENLTGGIGSNVSAIARQFNNSVQSTINAEERIQNRNMIMIMLFGGDEVAAGELVNETNQNTLRIQELNQLKNNCTCTSEVKTMLQEQIQNIEQEQTRLKELAQNQTQSKGLLGWLWK